MRRILLNISLGYDANTNILEVIQMFSEAWGTFNATKIVTCFHKSRIVPQGEGRSELEHVSESDVDMVKIWQHLYKNYILR